MCVYVSMLTFVYLCASPCLWSGCGARQRDGLHSHTNPHTCSTAGSSSSSNNRKCDTEVGQLHTGCYCVCVCADRQRAVCVQHLSLTVVTRWRSLPIKQPDLWAPPTTATVTVVDATDDAVYTATRFLSNISRILMLWPVGKLLWDVQLSSAISRLGLIFQIHTWHDLLIVVNRCMYSIDPKLLLDVCCKCFDILIIMLVNKMFF